MKFNEGVEYREAATKTQGARIAQAQTLEADSNPPPARCRGAFHRQLRFHRRPDARD